MENVIGIIGAMDEEIECYFKYLKNIKEIQYKIFTFYTGKFHNKPVVLVKSGVGKVFSAMVAQLLIDKFDTKKIIFTGVGGSLNKTLNIGDVVISVDLVHHDFNATALGFKRGQISYTDYRFFTAEKTLLKIALKTKIKNHKVIKGRILTGDQFFTQKEKKEHKYLYDELHGDCIEMEGAAVAQVCTINQIPFIVIRTVSDKADENAVLDYNSFKNTVAENSFKIVETIIKNLK